MEPLSLNVIKEDYKRVLQRPEETKLNHSNWSRPRKRLIEKGIIDCQERGLIKVRLPRFKEFIEREKEFA